VLGQVVWLGRGPSAGVVGTEAVLWTRTELAGGGSFAAYWADGAAEEGQLGVMIGRSPRRAGRVAVREVPKARAAVLRGLPGG
jgi:hypothetical protein